MTSRDFRRSAGRRLARASVALKRYLLATSLLAGLAPFLPWSAGTAQAAPVSNTQPSAGPSNADLMKMIVDLQASVGELRSENAELKTEVQHVQAQAGQAQATAGQAQSTASQAVASAAALAPPTAEQRKAAYGGMPAQGLPAVSAPNFKIDLGGG